MTAELFAGDALPSSGKVIVRNRDPDPSAEEFIVSSSKELPRDVPLGLLVHLERPAGLANEAKVLREALHQFFGAQSALARRRLELR